MPAQFALINGKQTSTISIDDRGLNYGDGVFRTLAVVESRPKHQEQQLNKLFADCERLFIPIPDKTLLRQEIALICSQLTSEKAALKIISTRGRGDRGYRINPNVEPTRILAVYPWPEYSLENYQQGVQIRICQTKLGYNSQLAGIKHLNRLEQILARHEWQDAAIAEGIMLDQENRVISGTFTNIFLVKNQRLITPDLSLCGVAGVMRQIILAKAHQQGQACEIRTVSINELLTAEAVFLTNSLIGIWPVRQLASTIYLKEKRDLYYQLLYKFLA